LKVLIIGSGGREHAIADAFARSSECTKIYLSPGNAGIAKEYECVPLADKMQILEFVQKHNIAMVFIGPEQPISEGLSDFLREHKVRVLAPSRAAAQLETSKAFAKRIMQKYGVPTARYRFIQSAAELDFCMQEFSFPVVLKADGLAAGKGVIICEDRSSAVKAAEALLSQKAGQSGILVEEYLMGWETSLFAFCDGKDFVTSLFLQDHKQLYDNDRGPNTGGMGAICPISEAETYRQVIEDEILSPVLKAMQNEGIPYEGILYLGLMITREGPKVIEFNCRFGDPEAQVVLPLLQTDFVLLCNAVIDHKIQGLKLSWKNAHAIAVVAAAPGYPGPYTKGIPIKIPRIKSKVMYAGVSEDASGLKSSGGRVLALVNVAESAQEAREAVYRDMDAIDFQGKVYRKDIGLRENQVF